MSSEASYSGAHGSEDLELAAPHGFARDQPHGAPSGGGSAGPPHEPEGLTAPLLGKRLIAFESEDF